jgi:hypothetical protein
VTFEYGLTTGYGTTVNGYPLTIPVGNTVVDSSAIFSAGLDLGITYHYHVMASNSHGSADGADMTFMTLALAPEISTKLATDVTSTGAQLWAKVDTKGADSTVIKF